MQPQIVQEIREQSIKEEVGKVIRSIEPVVLNRIDMKKEHIDRIKEGFRWVFQEGDGTGVKYFKTRHINQQERQEQPKLYMVEMTRLVEMQKENVWNVTT